MGSRGIIVLAKDQEAARRHFHINDPNAGARYTRTGRKFFPNPDLEQAFLQRARTTLSKAGIWDDLHTDWIVLDCEIMPWSLKAQNLLRRTYAPTGAAAINTLTKAQDIIAQAADRGVDMSHIQQANDQRLQAAHAYRNAYQHYCWDTNDLENIRVAPFHVLAAQDQLLTDRPHRWHMAKAHLLQETDPSLFQRTLHKVVNLDNRAEDAIRRHLVE